MATTGIFRDLPAERYHGGGEINKSLLDKVNKSAAHARHYLQNKGLEEREETAALIIGSAYHMMILEKEKFDNNFITAPTCDKRTKDGKAEWTLFLADNADKTVLTPEQMDTVLAMEAATLAHPMACKLLQNGDPEVSVYWQDQETGLNCRCRPDYLRHDGLIVDLKTTEDASPDGFARSVGKYRYHVQAAYYMQGVEAVTGVRPKGFVFIAIEKKPPYAIGIYVIDEATLNIGEIEFRRDLNTLIRSRETEVWPSYNNGEIATLSMPAWFFKQFETGE